MPSPLQVSFAPADVARTVGISLLVLLLVGAPTPIFNETLESNLGDIQGGLRRLVPGGRGSRARLAGARRHDCERFSASFLGLVLYLLAAGIIYCVPDARLPGQRRTSSSSGWPSSADRRGHGGRHPARAAVRRSRRYADHGRVRVAVWTLALAAICVLLSRIADLQPGYMYGIIGTFTFAAVLSVSGRGPHGGARGGRAAHPGRWRHGSCASRSSPLPGSRPQAST